MAITKITKGKKSKRILKYLFDTESNDIASHFILTVSGQHVDLRGYDYEWIDAQYKALRELAKKGDKTHQIYHIIQAFAQNEIDYHDLFQITKANELGFELANAIAGPDSQFVVVTRASPDNELVHNDLIISGILMSSKSLQTNNVSVKNIRAKNDQVLKNNFIMQHPNIKNNKAVD